MAAGGFEAAANDNMGLGPGNLYDMNEERELRVDSILL